MNCSDDSPLVFVAGDMPSQMRDDLARNLRNAFAARVADNCVLEPRDSKNDPKCEVFPSCHFSYYARSGTSVSVPTFSDNHGALTGSQGKGALPNVYPYDAHKANTSRTNHGQFVPKVAKDLEKNQDVYHNMCASFEEVMAWIQAKVCES